jgi:NADH:ubiquinone oxidoreductase subunit 2 (subunit N)
MWALIVILVITGAIRLSYYLRIAVVMYGRSAGSPASVARLAAAGSLAPRAVDRSVSLVGVFPGLLLSLIRKALAGWLERANDVFA